MAKKPATTSSGQGFELFARNVLIQLMNENEVSAAQLSRRLGIHESAISRWITSDSSRRRLPKSLDTVRQIAKAFNVPVHYLLRDPH